MKNTAAFLTRPFVIIHLKFQKLIEKLFFKSVSTSLSKRLTFSIENFILMLIVFYIFLKKAVYPWTGSLYPEGTGFRLDWMSFGLDGIIPFVPEMAIFYVYIFYSTVIITMLYFAFIDPEKGLLLSWSLVIINIIAVTIYIFFPVSTYWYRQELLANPVTDNFWAKTMYEYYNGDTSFNCFPSLHAALSTLMAYTWIRYARNFVDKNIFIIAVAVFEMIVAIGVILSTLFVKQHYIVDEIAGILLAVFVANIVFKGLRQNHL